MADLIVNVVFDAKTQTARAYPEKLNVPAGSFRLRWTLMTINRPHPWNNAIFQNVLLPVTSERVFKNFELNPYDAEIDNHNTETGTQVYAYNFILEFDGKSFQVDPTIINLPDMADEKPELETGVHRRLDTESESLSAKA